MLECEVRANLVYRDFTRVGGEKIPDAKTIGRWGMAVGPQVIQQIHDRIVQIARDHRVTQGRRMRIDTTVVETNIDYPTDSSLLGDGVRVPTRTMKKITAIAGPTGAKLRDRSRSVTWRVLEIARAARSKRAAGQAKLKAYHQLLAATSRVLGQAKCFAMEIRAGVKVAADAARETVLQRLRGTLETMVPSVQQVLRQTKARILTGDTHVRGKIVSLFEPSTEVIRKGKAAKPTEFGKMAARRPPPLNHVPSSCVSARRPRDAAARG